MKSSIYTTACTALLFSTVHALDMTKYSEDATISSSFKPFITEFFTTLEDPLAGDKFSDFFPFDNTGTVLFDGGIEVHNRTDIVGERQAFGARNGRLNHIVTAGDVGLTTDKTQAYKVGLTLQATASPGNVCTQREGQAIFTVKFGEKFALPELTPHSGFLGEYRFKFLTLEVPCKK